MSASVSLDCLRHKPQTKERLLSFDNTSSALCIHISYSLIIKTTSEQVSSGFVIHWVQGVSANRLQTWSVDQLYGRGGFLKGWIQLCQKTGEPPLDLLEDMQSIGVAPVFFGLNLPLDRFKSWDDWFSDLALWVRRSYERHEATASTDENHVANLCVYVEEKFSKFPHAFHLEQSSGLSAANEAVMEAISLASQCNHAVRVAIGVFQGRTRSSVCPGRQLPRFTDCHCDISGGRVSSHPEHLAYQDACLELVKALVDRFQGLIRLPCSYDTWSKMEVIFGAVAGSRLLHHCRIDQEVVSLCRTFVDSALACSWLYIGIDRREKCRTTLLEWIETLPSHFDRDAEAIKIRITKLFQEEEEEKRESILFSVALHKFTDVRSKSELHVHELWQHFTEPTPNSSQYDLAQPKPDMWQQPYRTSTLSPHPREASSMPAHILSPPNSFAYQCHPHRNSVQVQNPCSPVRSNRPTSPQPGEHQHQITGIAVSISPYLPLPSLPEPHQPLADGYYAPHIPPVSYLPSTSYISPMSHMMLPGASYAAQSHHNGPSMDNSYPAQSTYRPDYSHSPIHFGHYESS
ncbi:hypothetical protein PM082_006854 [Marasmius tenuissimus]|nr:hypothetical protein PM082_006854 [Marasmius tenuissimus]